MTEVQILGLIAVGALVALAVQPKKKDAPKAQANPPVIVPDVSDERDFIYESKSDHIPIITNLTQFMLSVEDQGKTNSCTANAMTSLLEMMTKWLKPEQAQQLSRMFLYYVARTYSNRQGSDNGTQLRDLLKAMQEYGCCPESVYPFDAAKINDQPPPEAYAAASNFKISSYARCNDLRKALSDGFPVLIAMYLRNGFGNRQWLDYPTQTIFGSHAMVIVGHDDTRQTFLALNSWGIAWDGDGLIEIPYSVVAADMHDAWVVLGIQNWLDRVIGKIKTFWWAT